MIRTIGGQRALWPTGRRGTIRWALVEPLLPVLRYYLRNAVRNGYLRRFLLVSALESAQLRLLGELFPQARMPRGYVLRGPRDMREGRFEPAVTQLVDRLAQVHDTFIDVGAHIGYYTCLARSLGCSVVAVEPDPVSLYHLLRNLRENHWDDVRVQHVAVGPAVGVGGIYARALCTSLVPGWADGEEPRRLVPVLPLTEVVPPDVGSLLLKVDIEGYELSSLAAATDLLSRTPAPCWIVENCPTKPNPGGHNPQFCDVFRLFFAHGYRAWEVAGPARLEPVTPLRVGRWEENGGPDVGTYNYLFVRDDACGEVVAQLAGDEPRPPS